MTLSKPPRSVRNLNPGNLRKGIPWAGLAPTQPDPDFCTFADAAHGFRALAIDLYTKWAKDGLRTIAAIIGKYAPPSENDTQAYINAVSASTGIAPDDELALNESGELQSMCRAVSVHEAGGWFFQTTDLVFGVQMALAYLKPPEPPLVA